MRILSLEELPKEPCIKASRHASTLLPLPNGAVLAAYFAGAYEGESDVDVYIARRNVDGIWSTPFRVSKEEGIAHWNPVLALRSNGDVILFYKVGFEIAFWKTMVRVSRDGGTNWDEPQGLVSGDSGGRGPVRNKVIVLKDGTWLAGGSLERGIRWTAFADRSEDEGRTWNRSADIAIFGSGAAFANVRDAIPKMSIAVSEQSYLGRGVIQPSLWEDPSSGVHMLLRSTEGFAYRSDSLDRGRSWSEPYRTEIPNNNSALDLVRLDDGRLALAHNPVAGNWGERTPLIISISNDRGCAWERAAVLDDGPGEFSYPAIVKGPDTLFVSWTRNRTEIAFAVLSN